MGLVHQFNLFWTCWVRCTSWKSIIYHNGHLYDQFEFDLVNDFTLIDADLQVNEPERNCVLSYSFDDFTLIDADLQVNEPERNSVLSFSFDDFTLIDADLQVNEPERNCVLWFCGICCGSKGTPDDNLSTGYK